MTQALTEHGCFQQYLHRMEERALSLHVGHCGAQASPVRQLGWFEKIIVHIEPLVSEISTNK